MKSQVDIKTTASWGIVARAEVDGRHIFQPDDLIDVALFHSRLRLLCSYAPSSASRCMMTAGSLAAKILKSILLLLSGGGSPA